MHTSLDKKYTFDSLDVLSWHPNASKYAPEWLSVNGVEGCSEADGGRRGESW